jgi:hypothetical protein
MVTHDIDEALYLADRLILMTDGPAATVGQIVALPFSRPRTRVTCSSTRSTSRIGARFSTSSSTTPTSRGRPDAKFLGAAYRPPPRRAFRVGHARDRRRATFPGCFLGWRTANGVVSAMPSGSTNRTTTK